MIRVERIDPFTNPNQSKVVLCIDSVNLSVAIRLERDDFHMPLDVRKETLIRIPLEFYPEMKAAYSYLLSPKTQYILNRICKGHHIDRRDYCGKLNMDAVWALDDLVAGLNELPRSISMDPIRDDST